ncbi:hypothetical protein N836_05420 [Leptolyngbya sp. Heron Island J]|uniref:hypothetical protein n=1 Tax=Leptolyngbya sp. Heron Island J TaxID=1385935 RepID=UPI0003B9C792|nr:hypothetical protein [Leptolyngbya sp. Heron Island J]ESA37002.1 hypothetical protein N836_05420 [Leptolyngbya sp. Heron Island J]
MQLELVPLLQLQRDLYDISDGQERFRTYLKTMLNADASDAELLPMATMNPMGKEHIPAMLDNLLAINAEAVAAQAIADVSDQLQEDSATFKLGLVVADDLMGGWTNRYTAEFSYRFQIEPSLKRKWLTVMLWTSETPSVQTVREETLITLYRTAYIRHHGIAHTLQEMLHQEGYAMAMAGCQQPTLAKDDMAYMQEVIVPHLSTLDYPTIMACLYGDRAAHALGYPPQGLSEHAGFALALYQSRDSWPN